MERVDYPSLVLRAEKILWRVFPAAKEGLYSVIDDKGNIVKRNVDIETAEIEINNASKNQDENK